MGECVVGSNILIPKPVASWSPLAKLIFKFELVSRDNRKCLIGERTFIVRKKAARIEDKRLVTVDINA